MKSFTEKFMEDMCLKDFAEATVQSYFRSVRYFFERMEPIKKAEDVVEEDVRKYFLHLKNDRLYKVSALKIAVSGLRFFLRRHWGVSGKFSLLCVPSKMKRKSQQS